MSVRPARGFSHDGIVKAGEEQYPCKVTNMSATGATLTFSSPIELPPRFTVQLTRDGRVVRSCSVLWNEGLRVGVVFDGRQFSQDGPVSD